MQRDITTIDEFLASDTSANNTRFFSTVDQSVNFHQHDARVFNGLCNEVPLLADTLDAAHQTSQGCLNEKQAASLAFDVFNAYHKREPKLVDSGGNGLSRRIVSEAMQTDAYKEMHDDTVLEPTASSLATCAFVGRVMRELPYEVKQRAQQEERARQAKEEANAMLELAMDSGADSDEVKRLEQQANEANEQHQQAVEALDATVPQQALAKAVAVASKTAQEEVENTMQAARLAGSMAGIHTPVSPDDALKLANHLRDNYGLRRLLEVVGRVVVDAQARRMAKSTHDAGVTVDVTLGGDPSLMLEEELVGLLGGNVQRLNVLRRMVEETAEQLEVEAMLPAAKGPVVVCIDCSGSMSTSTPTPYGAMTLMDQAKALAMVVTHAATKRARKSSVLFFESYAHDPIVFDPKRAEEIYEHIGTVTRQGPAGGTNFDNALEAAFEQIGTGDFKRADIVFITDGECHLSERTVAQFKEMQTRNGLAMLSLFVGGVTADTSGIAALSDRAMYSTEMLGNDAPQIYDAVI